MSGYLTGHCILEKEVRTGVMKTRKDPLEFHLRCRNGDGRCACPHHSDNEAECKFCSAVVIGSDRCSDKEACKARMSKRLEGKRRTVELGEFKEKHKSEANERKRVARPKGSGRCEHCGEETSGGRFKMGHDMKLKGELYRDVRERQDHNSLAELMIRGWVPKDLDENASAKPSKAWQVAEKIYNDKTGRDSFLATRIEVRTGGDG